MCALWPFPMNRNTTKLYCILNKCKCHNHSKIWSQKPKTAQMNLTIPPAQMHLLALSVHTHIYLAIHLNKHIYLNMPQDYLDIPFVQTETHGNRRAYAMYSSLWKFLNNFSIIHVVALHYNGSLLAVIMKRHKLYFCNNLNRNIPYYFPTLPLV